jgi:hypothetical protein
MNHSIVKIQSQSTRLFTLAASATTFSSGIIIVKAVIIIASIMRKANRLAASLVGRGTVGVVNVTVLKYEYSA